MKEPKTCFAIGLALAGLASFFVYVNRLDFAAYNALGAIGFFIRSTWRD